MSKKINIVFHKDSDESQNPKKITISLEDQMSFEDLLEIVSVQEDIPSSNYGFYFESGSGFDRLPIKASVQPYLGSDKLHLKGLPYTVSISTTEGKKRLEVSPSDTPATLKEKLLSQHGISLPDLAYFSFSGRSIEDDSTLKEEGIIDICVDNLNDGKNNLVEISTPFKVKITDKKASSEKDIEINDFDSIEDVMQKYCDAGNRTYVPESAIYLNGEQIENYERVFDVKSKVKNGVCLEYKSAPFRIEIHEDNAENELDGIENISLSVEDHWTVRDLREHFNQEEKSRAMAESDRFFLREAALDEETLLVKLKLPEGEVVHLRRGEVESFCNYICGDCGAELKLRQTDVVRCEYCFFRIVHKVRTPEVCQYNCR